ncbi:MAG: hypothetical protein AAGE61_02825 [Pseudomonadota bacterium]
MLDHDKRNRKMMSLRRIKWTPCTLLLAIVLSGCSVGDHTAFDLEAERTGQVDENGFPVFLGKQYERDVPLMSTTERARVERDLEALAESRTPGTDEAAAAQGGVRDANQLQERLRSIARNHAAQAEAEIDQSCDTRSNGQVVCKGESQP